jgi:hypothetical protein
MRDDLRPSDIDWKIHKDFYNNISDYLKDDGIMFISEVDPYNKNFYIDGELYDKRPEVPMKDFRSMTESNNLKIKRMTPYLVEDAECCVLEISKI